MSFSKKEYGCKGTGETTCIEWYTFRDKLM
jgi:hypothetical protein